MPRTASESVTLCPAVKAVTVSRSRRPPRDQEQQAADEEQVIDAREDVLDAEGTVARASRRGARDVPGMVRRGSLARSTACTTRPSASVTRTSASLWPVVSPSTPTVRPTRPCVSQRTTHRAVTLSMPAVSSTEESRTHSGGRTGVNVAPMGWTIGIFHDTPADARPTPRSRATRAPCRARPRIAKTNLPARAHSAIELQRAAHPRSPARFRRARRTWRVARACGSPGVICRSSDHWAATRDRTASTLGQPGPVLSSTHTRCIP